MLLMDIEVEQSLPEFHRIRPVGVLCQVFRRKESAAGGDCASCALIFGDNVQYLYQATPVGFPEQ
jgi:hypothetical protein